MMETQERFDVEDPISIETGAVASRILRCLHLLDSDGKVYVKNLEALSGGTTNKIFRCELSNGTTLLFRIFGSGTELLIDREREALSFRTAARNGLGPKLFGTFQNGRVEEFIKGRPLTAAEMRQPQISCLIACKLGMFHLIEDFDDGTDKSPLVLLQIKSYLSLLLLEHGDVSHEWNLKQIHEEGFPSLQKRLIALKSPVVFCHNDLSHMNILLKDSEGQEQDVVFVDMEYSGWNYRGFDLANHLCEWASNFQSSTHPHVLDFKDSSPSLQQQRVFAQAYLSSYHGRKSTPTEENLLLQEVQEFTIASHLMWGLWGLLQSKLSNISFDYISYAAQRMEQYFALTKEQREETS